MILMVLDTDYIGTFAVGCKSYYHTLMTTTAPASNTC